ncbi:hypothetical protein [Hyphomicrobium sp. ghe19]|uniref:hypothetical protein n=1 Tax=Hyphomicrobium sp. ghe19 TaxID=2682968 RepID=UPI00136793B8|nr:hypothetical protein HYPP_01868 [Hyphomicrobium sp. ghe19]
MSPQEEKARSELSRLPGTTFTSERLDNLIAIVLQYEQDFEDRLKRNRGAKGKGDRSRSKDAADEARKIKESADKLISLISGHGGSGIDWAGALRANCLIADLQDGVLGADIPTDEWRAQITRLLKCFSELGEARRTYYAEEPDDRETLYPSDTTRVFATCLAYAFIGAGGVFGSEAGKAGFPALLKSVWLLLPKSRGSMNATSFARSLAQSIPDEVMADLLDAQKHPGRADYVMRTMTAWRSSRPL